MSDDMRERVLLQITQEDLKKAKDDEIARGGEKGVSLNSRAAIYSLDRQLKAALLANREKDAEIARLKHEYSKFSSLHDANPLSGLSGGGLNVLGDQPSMKVDDLAVKACRDAGWPNTEECRTQALAMMRTIQNQYVVYVEKGK